MIESGELGKSESVKYTYDKNGNLLSEVAARYRKDYVYNAQNRMIFSDVQDAFLNTRNLTEYAYDAFGRRIETIEYLGDSTRNLYDGFSFDVVGKTLLQTRSAPAMTEQKYRAGSAAGHPELGSGSAAGRSGAGVANGTRYRYIGDEPLKNAGSAGAGNAGAASAQAGTTAAAKTRSRPNSEYVLYSNGEPVAVNSDNGVSYFGTDILGSVRSVTDRNGQVKASYEYDAFGTPYLSNLENDVGFGYTGKIFDSATGLYDYGFRDYAPNSARFTTVDPVRDGNNWFSYVVNDPVNYIDPFGLDTLKTWAQELVDRNSVDSETNETLRFLRNDTPYNFVIIPEEDCPYTSANELIVKPGDLISVSSMEGFYIVETKQHIKLSNGWSATVNIDQNGNVSNETIHLENSSKNIGWIIAQTQKDKCGVKIPPVQEWNERKKNEEPIVENAIKSIDENYSWEACLAANGCLPIKNVSWKNGEFKLNSKININDTINALLTPPLFFTLGINNSNNTMSSKKNH